MHKMQSKVTYYGRIHIEPRPGPSAIANIGSWFKKVGWTTVQLSGRSGPWEGEPFGSKPWGISFPGTPQSTLQAPIHGTIPLDSPGPGPVTVWFSAVWLNPNETNAITIQKADDNQSGYRIHDMYAENDSTAAIFSDGVESSGGAIIGETPGGFGPGGYVPGLPGSEEPVTKPTPGTLPGGLPSKIPGEKSFKIPGEKSFKIPGSGITSDGWRLEQGKWYEGTIKASTGITMDSALQLIGFDSVSVTEFPGGKATFSGQWNGTTGNYLLKEKQYEVISLQEVAAQDSPKGKPELGSEDYSWQPTKPPFEDTSPKGKPELGSEDYSWQPTRPPFEDTGSRPSIEDYRGEQQEEETATESGSNTALWILGILGVSVAGYLALKGTK